MTACSAKLTPAWTTSSQTHFARSDARDNDRHRALLAKDGIEFIRGLFQAHLDARAAAEPTVEVVGADGVARPHVRVSTRTVETPFGELTVTRKLYRAVGVTAIAPLDAALGLPDEKYTLEVRRIVAEESAKSSFDEVVELIDKRTGASVPKRQVEELTERAAQDFDEFYAARLRDPEATDDVARAELRRQGGRDAARRPARSDAQGRRSDAAHAALAACQGREAEPQAHGTGRRALLAGEAGGAAR